MLLTKGLIRVGIGVPPDAEFELVDIDDLYRYASSTELWLFRRPAAGYQSAVSRHGHVGWPRDVPRPIDSFRFEHLQYPDFHDRERPEA
jgi:hypothetical protein